MNRGKSKTTSTASEPVWNLEAMYATPADWERDFARIEPLTRNFAAFRGRLAESPAVLRDAIAADDEASRVGEKVFCYAHMRSDEDTSNSANRARVDRVESLFASLSELSAWFDPEVMAIPDPVMKCFLDAPELSLYRRSLIELLRDKPHTLSEPEERLIGSFSESLGMPDKVFGILTDSDMDFGFIHDENGKRRKLTHANYSGFLESSDREVRRRAFRKLHGTYRKFENTLAATLDGEVKLHNTEARVRHYGSALESALSGDNIDPSVYRNLINTVHDNLGGFYKYMDLRKQILKLDRLDMYDMFCPLLPGCRREYSFEEAAKMVRQALAPLGAQYVRDLEQAFAQRWVDVPQRRGKRSGAYSGGCFDSYPYLLLNFNHTLNDVFTLAHELGHSMHSFYSKRTQPYHYADYSIFVAEVASTTNELLLSHHLLASTEDRDLRAHLLGNLANEIRSTIFRQTMFAEFELAVHESSAAGVPLTPDFLCEKYASLNRLYYGPGVEADPLVAQEWSRIPHFYYNFYVYKYATGMSAAIRLAENLLSGDQAKREAYLKFLQAGDSKDPLDIMRDAGVDLATPEPVDAALRFFECTVNELETLLLS
ncbi:MAG: oligoendopeptidase F [Victivallaceae bacterium]|nr:oligoendopeptidase F [Victivallaceae bacterium]